jgi:hypothetical protein
MLQAQPREVLWPVVRRILVDMSDLPPLLTGVAIETEAETATPPTADKDFFLHC